MDDRFGAAELRSLLTSYAKALAEHETEINRLNVFPVADDDTGSNMRGTIDGVVEAIQDFDGGLSAVAAKIRRSALMAARGNSGIILSQWLHGFTGHLATASNVAAPDLTEAISVASASAYAAVEEPLEGTILTVARMAAERAEQSAASTIDAVWASAAEGGDAGLLSTPDYLAVLKEHGVVDSGGFGLAILFEIASGRPVQQMSCHSARANDPTTLDETTEWFEVTFLLDGADDVEPMKARWLEIGDSIDITGGDHGDLYSCHVHTGDIGGVIEAAIGVGRPFRIHVSELPSENRARG